MLVWFFNDKPNAKPLAFWGYVNRLIVVLMLWLLIFNLWVLLNIAWWIQFNPSSSSFMRIRLSELRAENPEATIKHEWVDYEKISKNLKRAVIASEDAKFLQHKGFDWQGIEAAYKKNIKKGKLVAGGSTITQQLAKNMFLSSNRSLFRKGEEVIITIMLENILSKQRIYEIYLNMIEWGNGVFGVEAAARHYYKTGAHHLTATQAAKLAVIVPNPRFYDKHRYTGYINRRTATIQARLYQVQVP